VDIFAKVAADGTVILAGTNFAQDSLKNWFKKTVGRVPTQPEIDAMMQVWADSGHVNIGTP